MAGRVPQAKEGADGGEAESGEGEGPPSASRGEAEGPSGDPSPARFTHRRGLPRLTYVVWTQARDELKERAAQNVRDMRQAMGLPDIEEGALPAEQVCPLALADAD